MCCHTTLCLRLIIFHKSGVYFILVLRHMKWQAPLIFFSFDSVVRFKIVALHYFKKVLSNFHFNPKFFFSAEIFFCQELFLSNFFVSNWNQTIRKTHNGNYDVVATPISRCRVVSPKNFSPTDISPTLLFARTNFYPVIGAAFLFILRGSTKRLSAKLFSTKRRVADRTNVLQFDN